MLNNSQEKNNGLIFVIKQYIKYNYDIQQQTTTTWYAEVRMHADIFFVDKIL